MLERKIVGMAPAPRLGIIRVIVCLAALLSVALENLPSFGDVSLAWYHPAGLLKWVPQTWSASLLGMPGPLLLFQVVLIVFLALAASGAAATFTLSVSAILYFFYAGILRSYGTLFNNGFVILYLLGLMVFLRAGAGFSLDEQWKREKGRKPDLQPDSGTAWSIFLLRSVVALSYWQAAYAKLHFTGIGWLEAGNLKRFLVQESLGLSQFDGSLLSHAILLPDVFWGVFSFLVLAVEFLFPLALVSWSFRKVYPWLAAVIQVILLVLCPSLFLESATSLVLLLVFYDWDRILLKHLLPSQDRRGKRLPA